ncbi:LytTR family DNA-binding domain-containing protein [Collinsella aerofaciens]|nr:LytTR family DNA-binding domain-containing protein [Collinsella aerofaciens]MDB1907924.1 LytTR family DNA-binding domain-containing protein [Collinsella aerofaciens]MDB1910282.1 LytTR family DNA-binding domain-containing protein [Collinsella aerofaciens]MDB1911655.1 LytTR family DNA-binding domain-containing protein [Collinsella aerofaciens]
MLKIIACDDDVTFLDRLHRMIDRWSTETGTAVDVALVTRGEDLLARHAASRADIILLDMIMPLVNGMDTARELRQADTAVRLVFLTSSPEFALESYEVRAFDYLLKPVTYERLAQLLDELSSMRPAATDELVIKTSFGYHALRLSDIEYAEARNKHVVFHLRDGRDIEALESFRSVEDRLVQNATAATRSTCAISITLTARTSSCARARASRFRAAASRDSKTPTLRRALRVGDTDGLLGRNGPLGNPPRHDAALWRLCLGGAVRCRDQPASCA